MFLCSLPGYSPFGFPAQAIHVEVGTPTIFFYFISKVTSSNQLKLKVYQYKK